MSALQPPTMVDMTVESDYSDGHDDNDDVPQLVATMRSDGGKPNKKEVTVTVKWGTKRRSPRFSRKKSNAHQRQLKDCAPQQQSAARDAAVDQEEEEVIASLPFYPYEDNQTYNINEKIYAWDRGHLYKATVVKCNLDAPLGAKYLVHYNGYKKSHRRWLSALDMIKETPSSREFYEDCRTWGVKRNESRHANDNEPQVGTGVHVRFEDGIIYGGKIIDVSPASTKGFHTVKILYDDGAEETTSYPDPDISLVDDKDEYEVPVPVKKYVGPQNSTPLTEDGEPETSTKRKASETEVMPEPVTSSMYDEADYAELRMRYLMPRIREKVELAGGITLRRQCKASVIDQNTKGFKLLKSKISALQRKKDHGEIYRLLCQLRDWEMDPRRTPAAFDEAGKGDGDIEEVLDLTIGEDGEDGSDHDCIDVDDFITEVLLVNTNGKIEDGQNPLPLKALSSTVPDTPTSNGDASSNRNKSIVQSHSSVGDPPQMTNDKRNDEYNVLCRRYLMPRVYEKVKLEGGMVLRRQRKASLVERQTEGFQLLKSKICLLLKNNSRKEVHMLLRHLRDFEDRHLGDNKDEIDLTRDDDGSESTDSMDVDKYIKRVLLADEMLPIRTARNASIPEVVPSEWCARQSLSGGYVAANHFFMSSLAVERAETYFSSVVGTFSQSERQDASILAPGTAVTTQLECLQSQDGCCLSEGHKHAIEKPNAGRKRKAKKRPQKKAEINVTEIKWDDIPKPTGQLTIDDCRKFYVHGQSTGQANCKSRLPTHAQTNGYVSIPHHYGPNVHQHITSTAYSLPHFNPPATSDLAPDNNSSLLHSPTVNQPSQLTDIFYDLNQITPNFKVYQPHLSPLTKQASTNDFMPVAFTPPRTRCKTESSVARVVTPEDRSIASILSTIATKGTQTPEKKRRKQKYKLNLRKVQRALNLSCRVKVKNFGFLCGPVKRSPIKRSPESSAMERERPVGRLLAPVNLFNEPRQDTKRRKENAIDVPRFAITPKPSIVATRKLDNISLSKDWKRQTNRRSKGQWVPSGHLNGRWKAPHWVDINNFNTISTKSSKSKSPASSCKKELLPKLSMLVSEFVNKVGEEFAPQKSHPDSLDQIVCPRYFKPTVNTLLRNAHSAVESLLPAGDCEAWEVVELARSYYNHWRPRNTKVILLAESHSFTTRDRAFKGPGLDEGALPSYAGPRGFVSLVYCLAYGENGALEGKINDTANRGTSQFWTMFACCSRGVDHVALPDSKKQLASEFASDLLKGGKLSVEDRLQAKLEVLKDLQARGIWLIDVSVFGWYMPQPQEYSRSSISNEVHRKTKSRPPKDLKTPHLVLSWELFTKHVVREVADEGHLKLLIPIGMEVEAAVTRERMEDAIRGKSNARVAETFPAPNAWIPGGYRPFHEKLAAMVHEVAPRREQNVKAKQA